MAKKTNNSTTKQLSATVLTKRDAAKIGRDVKRFGDEAVSSKENARSALISLGIYTASGKISKRYG